MHKEGRHGRFVGHRILCGNISRHWEFLWLVFSGILVCYTLRVNMSVAAQSMRDDLNWNETQKGYVLSAFYWGYALGQIPASILMMQKTFSPKWTFGLAVFIPSVLTILVPICARSSYESALIIRMLIGLIESATFPSCYEFFVAWIPPQDKTYMIATMFSGVYMGEIVGFSLSGALIDCTIIVGDTDLGGWPSVFYVFGLLGVLWFPVWCIYAYDSPEVHPGITPEELAYIRGGGNTSSKIDGRRVERIVHNSVDLNPIAFGEDMEQAFARALGRSTDRVASNGGYTYDDSRAGLHSIDLNSTSDNSFNSANLTTKLLSEQVSPMDAESMLPLPDESTNLLGSPDRKHQGSLQVGSPSGTWSPPHIKGINNTVDDQSIPNNSHDENVQQPYLVDINEKIEFHRIPWKAIMKHPGFWNLMYSGWCMGYIQFLMLSEVPSYLTDVLGFDLSTAGILSTIPFGFMLLVALGNGQYLFRRQKYDGWSTKTVRRVSQVIGLGGPSIFMLLCAYTTDDKWPSYFLICTGTMCIGALQSGLSCAYLEFAPRFSPIINTFANAFGAGAGILGPILVSALITENLGDIRTGWNLAFLISAIMCSSSVVLWFFFAVSEPVLECNTLLPLAVPQTNKTAKLSYRGDGGEFNE